MGKFSWVCPFLLLIHQGKTMTISQAQLVDQLLRQLDYFSAYDDSQILTIAFDQTIFLESFQPLRFYLDEIKQNIQKLAQLDNPQIVNYLAEKITAQFRVLFDAVNQQHLPELAISPVTTASRHTSTQHDKNAVFHLPPEQRIHKYYEYLTRFNDYLANLEKLQQQTNDWQRKQQLQQQIEQYQQRRARCLAAIEQLEEYLAFKATTTSS